MMEAANSINAVEGALASASVCKTPTISIHHLSPAYRTTTSSFVEIPLAAEFEQRSP